LRARPGTRASASQSSIRDRSALLGPNPPQASDIQLATLAAVSGALELTAMWVRGQLDITREHLTEFITSAIVTVATDMTRSERS
jgi:hypothetical protein